MAAATAPINRLRLPNSTATMLMTSASQPATAQKVENEAAAVTAAMKITGHLGAFEAATTTIAASAAFRISSHTGVPVGDASDNAAAAAASTAIPTTALLSTDRDRPAGRVKTGADTAVTIPESRRVLLYPRANGSCPCVDDTFYSYVLHLLVCTVAPEPSKEP